MHPDEKNKCQEKKVDVKNIKEVVKAIGGPDYDKVSRGFFVAALFRIRSNEN